MFNNRAVITKQHLPIVLVPKFSRDHIVLQLAVHGAGLFQQLDMLVASLKRIGLMEGKHFYVNKPDVKLFESTLTTSQQRLFWVEFKGTGQVIHAILSHLDDAVNVATEVRDPTSTKNITYAHPTLFANWVDDILSSYNDDEPIIPAELSQVFAAHERQFVKLHDELRKLDTEKAIILSKSNAHQELRTAMRALMYFDVSKPASIRETRFIYLLAALDHACKQASEEKPSLFDRATKEAKVFERLFWIFSKYCGLMPTNMDPLKGYRDYRDLTVDREQVKNMKDAELMKIYHEKVLPMIAAMEARSLKVK